MRVYADFHGVVPSRRGAAVHAVVLGCHGTVLDLCAARARLREGLRLTLYADSSEDLDLEVEATASWYPDPNARNGGYWVGEYAAAALRDVARPLSVGRRGGLACYACGCVISAESAEPPNLLSTSCPACAARPLDVIAPPS